MEKKKNIIIVILIVVIGALFYYSFKQYNANKDLEIKLNESIKQNDEQDNQNVSSNNQNTNNDQNNSVINQELTESTKKELLNIVGLTEIGFKRDYGEDCRICSQEEINKLKTGNYVSSANNLLFNSIVKLSENSNEAIVNNASVDDIKNIIESYASTNNMLKSDYDHIINVPDNIYYCSMAGAGVCDGVSFSDYKLIAKKYNLNENGDRYFSTGEIYNGYYLYPAHGYTDGSAKIEDSLNFEISNNDVLLNYEIKLYDYDNDNLFKNQKVTFDFKQYDDGTYYLYSVKTINY